MRQSNSKTGSYVLTDIGGKGVRTLAPDQIDHLPRHPGVYLFRDNRGRLIYIGKAKSLRNRVRSYFGQAVGKDAKTLTLVNKITGIDFIVTNSEKEALILEDALIKQYRPRYNVDLKDDKRYLCIRIDTRHPFPAIQFVRRFQPDGAFYVGPFTSADSVRRTIKLLHRHFPLRSCTDTKFSRRTHPCLNYQIHRCLAPCVGYISKEAYQNLVEEAKLFLMGNREGLIKSLKRQMAEAAEALDFEKAAAIRDGLKAISKTLERQTVASPRQVDMDVFGLIRQDGWWGIFVAFLRQGTLMGSHYSEVEDACVPEDDFLSGFLVQFYGRNSFVPSTVLIPFNLSDRKIIQDWLSEKRGRKVTLHVPVRGEKRKLLNLAAENARIKFETFKRTLKAPLEELKAALSLKRIPKRIECYDISTLQGSETVGSKVSFQDGAPEKAGYRRFRIRHTARNDDVASMMEVLLRSLKREVEEGNLPDMILLDGGKGQLSAGEEVFKELGIHSVELLSIAKGRSKKKQFSDYFYVSGVKNPIYLDPHSDAFKLLSRIRDEAHRFAISYHRKRRGKAFLNSKLLAIPGIGPKRLKIIYQAYPSIEEIRKAPVDTLAGLPTFNRSLAERVKEKLEAYKHQDPS